MLTKKYYKAIAEIIKKTDCKRELVQRLSSYFAEDNPRYDDFKFFEACGVEFFKKEESVYPMTYESDKALNTEPFKIAPCQSCGGLKYLPWGS